MKFEVITKTLITKFYTVEAENEQEARHLMKEPDIIDEDYEEVISVTKLDTPQETI
jgi:hypothetical protein